MASDSDDPDSAIARLETALERIAVARAAPAAPVAPGPVDPQVAARLDALIAKLRGALPTGAA